MANNSAMESMFEKRDKAVERGRGIQNAFQELMQFQEKKEQRRRQEAGQKLSFLDNSLDDVATWRDTTPEQMGVLEGERQKIHQELELPYIPHPDPRPSRFTELFHSASVAANRGMPIEPLLFDFEVELGEPYMSKFFVDIGNELAMQGAGIPGQEQPPATNQADIDAAKGKKAEVPGVPTAGPITPQGKGLDWRGRLRQMLEPYAVQPKPITEQKEDWVGELKIIAQYGDTLSPAYVENHWRRGLTLGMTEPFRDAKGNVLYQADGQTPMFDAGQFVERQGALDPGERETIGISAANLMSRLTPESRESFKQWLGPEYQFEAAPAPTPGQNLAASLRRESMTFSALKAERDYYQKERDKRAKLGFGAADDQINQHIDTELADINSRLGGFRGDAEPTGEMGGPKPAPQKETGWATVVSVGGKIYDKNDCATFVKDVLGEHGAKVTQIGSIPVISTGAAASYEPLDVLELSQAGPGTTHHWAVVNPDGKTVSEVMTGDGDKVRFSSSRPITDLASRIRTVRRAKVTSAGAPVSQGDIPSMTEEERKTLEEKKRHNLQTEKGKGTEGVSPLYTNVSKTKGDMLRAAGFDQNVPGAEALKVVGILVRDGLAEIKNGSLVSRSKFNMKTGNLDDYAAAVARRISETNAKHKKASVATPTATPAREVKPASGGYGDIENDLLDFANRYGLDPKKNRGRYGGSPVTRAVVAELRSRKDKDPEKTAEQLMNKVFWPTYRNVRKSLRKK